MSELILPKQLNDELLEKALKNVFADKTVKVIKFYTKLAVANGDNYTSDVFRILVDYRIENSAPKQISLIVKCMLEIQGVSQLLNEYKMFVKEKEIYSNILPKVSKMFNENFAPKCYYLMENPSQIFVMEDLKESGFVVVDRQAGLDLEHCKLLIKKLAKYHAASMILAENEPDSMDLFDFGMINKNSSFGSAVPSMFIASLGSLIEETSSWPDFP